jgi:predicted permease
MPDWKQSVRQRFAALRLTTPAEADLVEEVAQHLEDRFRELYTGGASEDDARRQTMAELDDLYPLASSLERKQQMPKADLNESSQRGFFTGLAKDLRYAIRSMRRAPAFAAFVVLTLALGIGANTAVFTLINTLILNPLPVEKPGELASLVAADTRANAKSDAFFPISYADLKDYQSIEGVFQSLAGYTSVRPVTLQERGAAEGMFVELVTSNYFPVLGLTPARGRFFTPEEDTSAGARPVVVLNYAAWQKRFGGDANIVGRELRVNNLAFTVIGVAPPHFLGVNSIFGPDLWTPAAMAERLFPNQMQNALSDRRKAAFLGVGRLRPGVSQALARDKIGAIAASLAQSYRETNEGHTATVRPLRDVLLATNGTTAASMVFGSAALLAVVGIVLLIACSNVANLLMARSAARRQEMAVRLAMGAGRGRLVRQLLTESVLLGFLGGVTGLAIAIAGLDVLFGQLPGSANFPTPKLDATVFAFVLIVSLATGFLFGIFPALRSSRGAVAETLKESARNAGRSRSRVTLANALLVVQVAFSFLLLVTASLFLRSIGRAYEIDPGFQTAHLAVFPASPGQAGYSEPQARAFYRDVRDRVRNLSGVESVSWASNMPLWARSMTGFEVPGREQKSRADQIRVVINTVAPNYFETAGVRILAGRAFGDFDQETSLPVAIVNEKMARDYWAGDAMGKRILVPGEKQMRQIVGIARTGNYTGWGEPPQACVYVPLEQNYSDSMVLYVRSKWDPQPLIAPVEREVRAAGPQILIYGTRTGAGIVDSGLFQARMGVGLLTTFGLLALSLASIGLYGVLAYSVNLRRREIGVRMALGATRAGVLRLVLGGGMLLVMTGVMLGLGASLAIGRLLSRMLFGLPASDPVSISAAAAILSAVALLACYLPARWAARVDPLEALRQA